MDLILLAPLYPRTPRRYRNRFYYYYYYYYYYYPHANSKSNCFEYYSCANHLIEAFSADRTKKKSEGEGEPSHQLELR